jgi:hypothetical protein
VVEFLSNRPKTWGSIPNTAINKQINKQINKLFREDSLLGVKISNKILGRTRER